MMLSSRFTRALGAGALAVGLASALAPAASAVTVDKLPPVPTAHYRQDGPAGQAVLSPYGTAKIKCQGFHGSNTECYQQRPDGKWEALVYAWPLPLQIYPVWDDPASLDTVIPTLPELTGLHREQVRQAIPEPIRSAIPAQVWNAIPR